MKTFLDILGWVGLAILFYVFVYVYLAVFSNDIPTTISTLSDII